jgi:hypothetical protein
MPTVPHLGAFSVASYAAIKAPPPAEVTVSETVAVCVIDPPDPVIVIGYVPVAVDEATVKLIVEEPEPGAAIDVGLKETVTPAGWPEAERAIALLSPPDTVVETVEVPELPCTTETEVGEAEIAKSGTGAAVTVSETEVVWVVLPPVAVIVMG